MKLPSLCLPPHNLSFENDAASEQQHYLFFFQYKIAIATDIHQPCAGLLAFYMIWSAKNFLIPFYNLFFLLHRLRHLLVQKKKNRVNKKTSQNHLHHESFYQNSLTL